MSIFPERTKEEWVLAILASWEKWGNGKPLDPRTVEHLAVEFSKPLLPIKSPPFLINDFPRYDWMDYNGRFGWTPHA
ncbi:MAG TPA: hypothetical protein VMQ76_06950 [Terracidiphilus sp.]|jgi:hypothetical protein|nr:hypothetical protein [Terracidiphilus sp.]